MRPALCSRSTACAGAGAGFPLRAGAAPAGGCDGPALAAAGYPCCRANRPWRPTMVRRHPRSEIERLPQCHRRNARGLTTDRSHPAAAPGSGRASPRDLLPAAARSGRTGRFQYPERACRRGCSRASAMASSSPFSSTFISVRRCAERVGSDSRDRFHGSLAAVNFSPSVFQTRSQPPSAARVLEHDAGKQAGIVLPVAPARRLRGR